MAAKKGILILYDFYDNSENTLKYGFQLATHLDLSVTVLHCYPDKEYNRRFEFESLSYGNGVIALLKDIVNKISALPIVQKLNYAAVEGSVVDNVTRLSTQYDLVIIKGTTYNSSINRYLSSKSSYISAHSACPVLLIPPPCQYHGWNNVWYIQRRIDNIEYSKDQLEQLKIDEKKLVVKTFHQEKFTSPLWKLLSAGSTPSTYMEFQNQLIQKVNDEKIDLIIMFSYSIEGMKKYVKDNIKQDIFRAGIPMLIFQAK